MQVGQLDLVFVAVPRELRGDVFDAVTTFVVERSVDVDEWRLGWDFKKGRRYQVKRV